MAPSLMGDLLEEVLLHLPPNDPGHLFRAALVCKDWCRAISGSGFRRRFLKVHRMAAPILGFIYRSSFKKTHFMPTISSTFRLVYREIPWSAIHALQSRILFYDMDYRTFQLYLIVVNPITGMWLWLPKPKVPLNKQCWCWSATLICATAGCDHLNCDYGPFLVVLACIDGGFAHACVYSSETHVWSEPSKPISVQHHHELNPIRRPGGPNSVCGRWRLFWTEAAAGHSEQSLTSDCHSSDENLDLPLRTEVLSVTDGHDFVFIRMGSTIFTVDLKSGGVAKLFDGCESNMYDIVPYLSFCTPGPISRNSKAPEQTRISDPWPLASSHSVSPAALMEELVEEILLRFPPDDPTRLFRAAVVCKDWRHGFRQRFREFHHRTPPLLGLIYTS
ncbi:hypothetical protein EJB05_13854, partial [Eragrostis curvula]